MRPHAFGFCPFVSPLLFPSGIPPLRRRAQPARTASRASMCQHRRQAQLPASSVRQGAGPKPARQPSARGAQRGAFRRGRGTTKHARTAKRERPARIPPQTAVTTAQPASTKPRKDEPRASRATRAPFKTRRHKRPARTAPRARLHSTSPHRAPKARRRTQHARRVPVVATHSTKGSHAPRLRIHNVATAHSVSEPSLLLRWRLNVLLSDKAFFHQVRRAFPTPTAIARHRRTGVVLRARCATRPRSRSRRARPRRTPSRTGSAVRARLVVRRSTNFARAVRTKPLLPRFSRLTLS